MPAPLSNKQKGILAQLARRAWVECGRPGVDESDLADGSDGSDSARFEAWRHDEVRKACGKIGLRCCDQDDYASVKGHFLHVLGEDGAALNWHVRAQTNDRRVAWAVLQRESRALRTGADPSGMSYAAAICKRQFKCGLGEASEKQVWSLVYTVRNRAKAKRGKEQEQTEVTEKGK